MGIQHTRKTSMEDLPIDITFNILQRLPILSLLSVKLVSKYLYRVASHPDLASHYHLHKNSCGLIIRTWASHPTEPCYTHNLYLVGGQRGWKEIVQPPMKKEYNAGPMLSSNGLLCLLSYKRNHLGLDDSYRVCLFNPWTGEHNFLTHPRFNFSSSQIFGFGFDVKTGKYKLVRIIKESDKEGWTCKAEAFTLGKNGGQITKIKPPACPDESSDVVVGGAIHWLCEDEKTFWVDHNKPKFILAFDLVEEKFHQMATPEPDYEISGCYEISSRKISVLGGCLAITAYHLVTYGGPEVHIWLLKEYGVKESWTKTFKIGEHFQMFDPLHLLPSGNIVMSDKYLSAVCAYDPEEDCCTGYVQLDRPIVEICHVPSLVSPFI